MYLELPTMEMFKNELKERKIKEARITGYYITQADKDYGSTTSFRIVLSAKDEDEIVKVIEMIGYGITANKEEMDKYLKQTNETIEKYKKEFLKEKLILKTGEWKE